MIAKKIIAVIYGGDSEEWVISEKSAATVYKHLNRSKYEPYLVKMQHNHWEVKVGNDRFVPIDRADFSFTPKNEKIHFDYAFIEIHGTPGEDGKLQGYFDMIGLPYSTCGVLTSAITFNKGTCIAMLKYHGFKCSDSVVLRKEKAWDVKEIIKKVTLPCFVKPNNGGSSFGISKVTEETKLPAAIEKAFEHDHEVMVETFMQGREVTNGVFSYNGQIVALPITEIIPHQDHEFFDFAAKYEGASQEITPADLSATVTSLVQATTVNIYEKLGLRGLVRIDYILKNNEPHVIEVNTTPGLSAESLIPQQAAQMGISLETLFDQVIQATS